MKLICNEMSAVLLSRMGPGSVFWLRSSCPLNFYNRFVKRINMLVIILQMTEV